MTTRDTMLDQADGLGPVASSFLFSLLDDEGVEATVKQTLNSRSELPGDLRDSLDRAIDGHIRVAGFRSARSAPVAVILRQVSELVEKSQPLAATVLRAWYEIKPDLRNSVSAQLEVLGIPIRDADSLAEPMEAVFRRCQLTDALQTCMDSLHESDPSSVTLMVQLLSGKAIVDDFEAPEDTPMEIDDNQVVGRALDTALELLKEMPPTAPEWEKVIPGFSASLNALIESKNAEKEAASTLETLLVGIKEDYEDLLHFFMCDPDLWTVDNIEPGYQYQQVAERAQQLRGLLDNYAPAHPMALVAVVEMERSARRGELMPQVLEAGKALQRIFGAADEVGGDADQDSGDDDTESVCRRVTEPMGAVTDIETTQSTGEERDERDSDKQFAFISPCDIEERLLLLLTLQDTELDNEELEHENESLKAQVKELEKELYESRSQEESLRWAVAYRDNPAESGEIPDPEDVNAAVELARELYPGQLLFQLNADSKADESTFKWPEQVWKALQWLATDYFSSHLGDTPIPDIDQACRQACGMWYKTSQHETTMTQFRDSYTTRVDGRLIWLGEHIGKGNSFDPRRTIRIAFDWDRQLQKVVIGYIGQHQRSAIT